MHSLIHRKIGWPAIWVLSLVPLVLWALMYPLSERFGSSSRILTSFGQALGLVGVVMFSLNLVLGARWKWTEDLFGGMNKVYIAHHVLGGLSFTLLLVHPVALVINFLLTGAGSVAAKLYLWPAGCGLEGFLFASQDCAIQFGLVALVIMIATLYVTFYAKLKYQIWKLTHKFLGLAFFFGGLHALTIPSDVSSDRILRVYVLSIVCAGLVAVLYRTVLGALIVRRFTYVVKEVRRVSPAIVELVMEPTKRPMAYLPGQFLFVNFPRHAGLGEVHPFSISSSPDSGTVAIGIKALGDFTKKVLDIVPGDIARIEGPFGRTSYVHLPKVEQVWVAGGIGITPFLGMARALKADDPHRVDLYYSLVDRNETAFVAELEAIAAAKPNFRFFPHYAKEAGFLTADVIKKGSGPLADKDIVLCGPPPMMKGLKTQFAAMRVDPRTVHSEEFSIN